MPSNHASALRALLERDGFSLRRVLAESHGDDAAVQHAATANLRSALDAFIARFGDAPVRIIRAPGRINLRGMHVDTHGGWLNLMTHHREVVVIVAQDDGETVRLANSSPDHAPLQINLRQCLGPTGVPWEDWSGIGPQRPGGWGNYAIGCVLRAVFQWPDAPLRGMRMAVAGNLPEGSSLSSSAALCVALLLAIASAQDRTWDKASLILAARDAEWFAGARTGTSDQTAIVLGARGRLLHAAPYAPDFSIASARHVGWPEELCVLVVDSHTTRALSGAALAAYASNRFAYSIALHIFRAALRAQGHPPEFVERMDRLSRMLPGQLGGDAAITALLRGIPEEATLDAIRRTYDLPECEEQYARLFGHLPESDRPRRFRLRGPLCYAIAESARAHRFPELIASGRWEEAGRLMTIGHAGDRVSGAYPEAGENEPLYLHPGEYGASTPALDAIVDEALALGALGASLTGAGMGGSVLALCRRAEADRIAAGLREFLATPRYAAIARLACALSPASAAQLVCVNCPVAGAGPLDLPS